MPAAPEGIPNNSWHAEGFFAAAKIPGVVTT